MSLLPSAEDCIAGCALCAEKQRLGQIKVKDYDYTQARGPAFARWAASKLWDGSEFYLQFDAHSSFQPHWRKCRQRLAMRPKYRHLGWAGLPALWIGLTRSNQGSGKPAHSKPDGGLRERNNTVIFDS